MSLANKLKELGLNNTYTGAFGAGIYRDLPPYFT